MGVRVFVIQRPINRDEIGFPLEPKFTGAILEYFHVVRDEAEGGRIHAMRFETDDRGALQARILEMAERAAKDYDLTDFECFRRLGDVPSGEPCMLLRIAAPHYHEASRAMNDFLQELNTLGIRSQPIR